MMTIEEMIAVLTHFKNGGKVQGKNHYSTQWFDFVDGGMPAWQFPDCDYRIKHDPIFIYAEILPDGKVIKYSTEKFYEASGGTVRKFEEVTE